jgi:hypothetical protein
MRITVVTNMAKSLHPPSPDPDLELPTETATKLITEVRADIERLKWFLWHSNVFRGLQTVEGIAIDSVHRVRGQPGDQQTHGQKQQMRWTPRGAHPLLQIRTRVLNDQLADDFHRWYPNFSRAPDAAALAA